MHSPDDAALRPLFNELKARQIAFFEARLISPEAAREWRANVAAAWGALLARPLGELIDVDALVRAVDEVLSPRAANEAAGPVMRHVVPALAAALREDVRPLGEYVPTAAREAIDELLAGRDVVPPRLIRELFEHDAIEEVMRDVLYDVLTEFSDKVNPFFAEWGLPALLRRVMPIGAGAVNKALELVRAEFNARLEPEIRRFLRGMTRRSLRKAADVMTATSGDAKFIALRRRVAHWLYEQPISELTKGVDASHASRAQEIGQLISAHVVGMESVRAERATSIHAFVVEHGQAPLGDVLRAYGIVYEPDFDALAEATWPALAAALQSAPVRAWFADLIGEFYDGLGTSGG